MLRKIITSIRRGAANHSGLFALYLGSSTVSLTQVKGNKMLLRRQTDFTGADWQPAVRAMLSAMPTGSHLHLVLAPDFYQLVQLDKPELSEEEMLQALPWQVKDLVSISPEDIVADYIDLPVHSAQQAKINVVVASLSWLKQLVQQVTQSGQQLLTIQPEEWLALRLVKPTASATMLVIHQPEQEVLIQIVREGVLYFSRRTRGLGRMHLYSESELRNGELDRLQLELQRSMDYFESQLGLGAVSQLWMLKSDLVDVTDALGELEERVNTPVRLMSLESSFNRQEDDRPLTASLAVALGGALSYELGN